MEVVLMERIEKLGIMGDVVTVKNGFARNFLLPQGKALRATKANMESFELQRTQLEARNLEQRKEAEAVAARMDEVSIVLVRQASESDHLYGSVSFRDIAESLTEAGYAVERKQVILDQPIKTVGLTKVRIVLHPEVSVTIQVNVARSEEEAVAAVEAVNEESILEEAQAVFESEELAQAAAVDLGESEEEEAEAPAKVAEVAEVAEEDDASAETEDEAESEEDKE
ncbi:MAG: 50S ribosomal protein L9 [Alphaproteobacteria bacterium]|nr:MAG: 50S ribosomal protein L9 [Alphaproteobacteria bacterium]